MGVFNRLKPSRILRSAQVVFAAVVLVLAGCASTGRRDQAPAPTQATAAPQGFAISTQGVAATRAAERILSEGGNLFDAAIASSFVISVERPHSTGLGGGGFWLSFDSKTKTLTALDFRERAPQAIRLPENVLKQNPEAIPQLLQNTPLGGGIPGLVAGMGEVHRRFGKLPWRQILQPAIELAEQGFAVYPALEEAIEDRREVLSRDRDAARIFLQANGHSLSAGDLLIQRDLARTLRQIATEGPTDFYHGRLALTLLRGLKKMKSPIGATDLAKYRVIERKPVVTQTFGKTVAVMPPPSSGGIHLPQMLKLLEGESADLKRWGFQSEKSLHRIAQAMQVAFADRARYLGDPDFTRIPQAELLSDGYLEARKKAFFGKKMRPASSVTAFAREEFEKFAHESSDTTHLSLMDAEGNAIATTQSINGWMGSGQMIEGTGILLNNTMDDFSVADGIKNLYGAVGSEPNRLKPGKTPLSSMTPTIVFSNTAPEQPELVIGAPGGTRIITCILQVLINRWIYDRTLLESVLASRIHQQWMPDEILLEDPAPTRQFSHETDRALQERGHRVRRGKIHCRVQTVERTPHGFEAVTDPRGFGSAVVR